MAERLAASENRKAWLTPARDSQSVHAARAAHGSRRRRQRLNGVDGANGPVADSLVSPCRLEAPLCRAHFVERLTVVAHFFGPSGCPRFPQYFAACRRPSDVQRFGLPSRGKGHGADKFSAEFSVRISPLNELIRGRHRRLH
jgi:hypothetical protein